jgi:hypothetical protein
MLEVGEQEPGEKAYLKPGEASSKITPSSNVKFFNHRHCGIELYYHKFKFVNTLITLA